MAKHLRLGEILCREGLVNEDIIQEALQRQKQGKERFGEILISMGVVSEEDIINAMIRQGHQRVNILEIETIDFDLLKQFDEKFLRENLVIPYKLEQNQLSVVLYDIYNYQVTDKMAKQLGVNRVNSAIGTKSEILSFFDRWFSTVDIEVEEEEVDDYEIDVESLSSDSALVLMLNDIIEKAIRERASDIHFEPQYNAETRVRYRIDGELYERQRIPRSLHRKVVARIKILSKLNISQQNKPQDGEIRYPINSGYVNLRVSTIPTINGEKAEIRILGTSSELINLDKLGLSQINQEILKDVLNKRRGMVLITAQTGAGKTTTLYAALNFLNNPNVNIATIEDPVEIRLKGINQTQVNNNVSYADALRSILRQDPDILMVGEIRDNETADVATKASITGHLLLSTIHTIDVYGVITRLLNMEIPSYLIADSLELVISQRLVKKLCPNCKEEDPEGLEFIREIYPEKDLSQAKTYKPKGCILCGNTGFMGRTGIYDFFVIDEEIRELIANSDIRSIRNAKRKGKTLYEDGLDKVLDGTTPLEEFASVLGVRIPSLRYLKRSKR